MRYIRLAILLFACAFTATSATTVSDTIYLADGTGFAGSLVITWSSFSTSTGTVIAAGTITETVTNGVVSIDLEPHDSYTVRYYQGSSKSTQIEYWTVPVSSTAVTIASIRSTSVPTASMAVAISALTGGTTKGDLAVYNGSAFVRFGAGANGKAVISDSTSATGLNWGSIPVASTDLSDAASLVYTADSRLTDARTPTSHASSHAAVGGDPLTLGESQITGLTTDLAARVSGASSLTTANAIPKVESSGILGESSISDNGTDTVTVSGRAVSVSPALPTGAVAASGQLEYWVKYTIPYTDSIFVAASTSATKTVLAVPAGGCITGVRVKHSTAFAGTGITALTLSGGDGTTANVYWPAYDLMATVADTTQWLDGGCFSSSAAAHSIVLTFTATGANFGDGSATALTAGGVDVWLKVSVLP